MENSIPPPSSSLRTTRLIIRIFASLLMLFYLLVFVPKLIQDLLEESPSTPADGGWEGSLVTIGFLVYVLGYIFTWWRGLVGGIILVAAAAIMFASHMVAAQGELEFVPFLVFSVPMILVGALYIIFWWKKS
ncbi:MAG: hypothetical protein ISS17_02710 [Bacteroidales bacterium]|nr:hypothetical protein [Bacteroidales bacterium]